MKGKIKLWWAITPVLVVMIAVSGFIMNEPVHRFTMDVNPSIEVVSNRLEKVVQVNPLNDDAKALLQNFELKEKDLDTVISDLVDLMVLEGYISSDKENAVMITVSDEKSEKQVVNKVNQVIAAYLENKQIEARIVNQSIVDSNNSQSNLTGKEIMVKKITSINNDFTSKQLQEMTLNEIINYASQKGIGLEQIFKIIMDSNKMDDEKEITNSSETIISAEDAKKIALSLANGEIIKIELDDDDAKYEIEIRFNGKKYEVEIDAYSGKVLDLDADDDDEVNYNDEDEDDDDDDEEDDN